MFILMDKSEDFNASNHANSAKLVDFFYLTLCQFYMI